MGVTETLTGRNTEFAEHRFAAGLRMMPSLRTIVIGCVDPRVDPTDVLGTEPGEVAAIRNVGGRITPAAVEELVMLRAVTQAAYFDVEESGLAAQAVADPWAAVAHDVAVLRAEARLTGVRVSGLVYDVATGLVETVVAP